MLSWRNETRDNEAIAYDRFCVALLFVLSALLMLKQLVSSSYFTVVVDDAFSYPSWAWQFTAALKEGIIYPRWLPLNFWGYGSPTFLLYPPLAYYMVAFFSLFTDSILTAMNLVKFTAIFLSGTGIYFLVKEFHTPRVALFSAVFFIVLPYDIALMYLFGSFAAVVSCLWFAPILLFIHKYYKTREHKFLIWSGACFGGLILTHLIMAYMFAFVITAFAICMVVIGKRARDFVIIPTVLLIGLSLSAAYILPVVVEKKYLNLETFTLNPNAIIYSNMFIMPNMTGRFSKDYFWPIYYNSIVSHTTIFCLFIMIFLVCSLKLSGSANIASNRVINRFFLATAICSVLLMFGVSSFLWESIPFFKYILFPARWLHITVFAVCFLSASLFALLDSRQSTIIPSIVIALLFLTCLVWDYHYINGAPSFNKELLIPPPAVNNIMEHLPKGILIDKIDKVRAPSGETRFSLDGKGIAKVVTWNSAERIIDVSTHWPLSVRFRTFNFPGWTAYLDDKISEIRTETSTGAILVDVPNGMHRLRLVFTDTPVRLAGKLISLATALVLIAILMVNGRSRAGGIG